jgi:hypothetical protein
MQNVRSANRKLLTLARFVVPVALGGAIAAGMATASVKSSSPAASSLPAPPQTITATRITRPAGTLRPGTRVRSADLGQRVFPNARTGFALASVVDAQYPAATVDGGKTWRTDGPALHLNAAQAPLSVVFPGAANAHTFFAFGGGQVADATGDAGKHWWRAFLGDSVLAVVPRLGGGLVAVAQNATGVGSGAVTLVYVSTDGGHHWHLSSSFGT